MTIRGLAVLVYGLVCYGVFLAAFAGLIVFLIDEVTLLGLLDRGRTAAWPIALAIDAGLVLLFGLQHSVMARDGFKRVWRRWIPDSIERSTYVLAASLALLLIYALWQPLPLTLWSVDPHWLRSVIWGLFALGWVVVFVSTCLFDHFELFGLRQVWTRFTGRAPAAIDFHTPGLYRWVRHPMMTGLLIAFWCVPDMTLGHGLFAGIMTGYIVVGTRFEERALVSAFGERYRTYQARVPRLLPRLSPVDVASNQYDDDTARPSRP